MVNPGDSYRKWLSKIYTVTGIKNFCPTQTNSDFQFFLTNETQLSLLKVLYRSKTIRAQEEFVPAGAASTMQCGYTIHITWFHLQQTPQPRHKKQRDYVVEQSSFPLIALFWLKIAPCRGRNWLFGNQVL